MDVNISFKSVRAAFTDLTNNNSRDDPRMDLTVGYLQKLIASRTSCRRKVMRLCETKQVLVCNVSVNRLVTNFRIVCHAEIIRLEGELQMIIKENSLLKLPAVKAPGVQKAALEGTSIHIQQFSIGCRKQK
jgi:hypothetical protein